MNTPWPTAVRATVVFTGILVLLMMMSGCTSSREIIVPKIEERQIEIPESLLKCLPEPLATKRWISQRDVALFLIRVAEAGEDCRTKLETVKKLIASQGIRIRDPT